LGYTILSINGGSASTSTSTAVTLVQWNVATAGTWLINVVAGWSSGAGNANLSVSLTNASYDISRITTLFNSFYTNFSCVLPIASANTTMYLVSNQSSAVITINPIYVYITKIA